MVGFHLVGVRHLSYESGGGESESCVAPVAGGTATDLVDHQSMGLHRRGRVVQGIRVLRRLPLQLALVAQRTRTTITEKPAQP